MLCPVGQIRNGSVATHFILLSGAPTGSARSEYVVVPEHFGQNEEPANGHEERTGNRPRSAPKLVINKAQ